MSARCSYVAYNKHFVVTADGEICRHYFNN